MDAKHIFEIIMKHMRINGSESCSTSEFESDVEDAANEIAERFQKFGSCSSCGGEVQFGKMAEHTYPDEKGKE